MRQPSMLKRILPGFLWQPLRAWGTALLTPIEFSFGSGHWRSSLRGVPVDARGDPLPWYSYPAIRFLERCDVRGLRVLELGGGQSTLWWAKRGASVVTIEGDSAWAERLAGAAIDLPVRVHHVPRSAFVDAKAALAFLDGETFDIIIVDGDLRARSSVAARFLLAPEGAMLLDDLYEHDFSAILATDCRRIDFTGHAPGVRRQHTTALLFWGDCRLLRVPDA